MRVLVLESSTSSAKAMVYDDQSGILRLLTRAYPPSVSDGATQDADGVLDLLLDLGREAAAGLSPSAIGLVGTWHSLLLCDRRLRPASRVYSWQYADSADFIEAFRQDRETAMDLYRRTGCMANTTYPFYQLLYLRSQGLDVDDARIFCQGGYNFFRLTGEYATSETIVSGSGFLNIHSLRLDERVLSMAGLREGQFAMLADHDFYGTLTVAAAARLGVEPGLPVTLPYADGAMNHLAAGAQRADRMSLSIGTSGAMRISTPQPVIPDSAGLWCYRAPGTWLSGAATNGATNCVEWFRRMLAGDMPFETLESRMSLDADNPFFLPFLYGERCPGWNSRRKGGFEDLRAGHDLGAMYAAVLEGVLFNLYQCYQILSGQAEPSEIRLSGGVLQSAGWTQMTADVFGRPVVAADNSQASLLGGAAMALYAAGAPAFSTLDDLEAFDRGEGVRFEPNPERTRFFQERYKRYLELYGRMA